MLHLVVLLSKSSTTHSLVLLRAGLTRIPFRYIIDQGAIPPLCELLSVADAKIIQVALNGLDNILKLGAAEVKRTNGQNPYAMMIEECYGLDKIEYLQSHENIEIYQKAFHLIETYFGVDEEENLPAVRPSERIDDLSK